MSSDASKPSVVVIVGPTAAGKTALAVDLAARLGGEIVNADSMQVFRGLDVGTAKPTNEERARVPFHLIDVVDPGDEFDAARFSARGREAINDILGRGRVAIVAGGTGLYIRALCHGLVDGPPRDERVREALRAERKELGLDELYARLERTDPETAGRTHPNDWVRIERALEVFELTGTPLSTLQSEHQFRDSPFRLLSIGAHRPRELLYNRIDSRLDSMWREGLVSETRTLLGAGLSRDELPLKALGYAHCARFLDGVLEEERALELAQRDTRRFARRQLTWFRRDKTTVWLGLPLEGAAAALLAERVRSWLKGDELDRVGLPLVDRI